MRVPAAAPRSAASAGGSSPLRSAGPARVGSWGGGERAPVAVFTLRAIQLAPDQGSWASQSVGRGLSGPKARVAGAGESDGCCLRSGFCAPARTRPRAGSACPIGSSTHPSQLYAEPVGAVRSTGGGGGGRRGRAAVRFASPHGGQGEGPTTRAVWFSLCVCSAGGRARARDKGGSVAKRVCGCGAYRRKGG